MMSFARIQCLKLISYAYWQSNSSSSTYSRKDTKGMSTEDSEELQYYELLTVMFAWIVLRT